MKGASEPGLRHTPFLSNNKAVFHLGRWDSAEARGVAKGPGCRNSLCKSVLRSWGSPPLGWEKSNVKGRCASICPPSPDPVQLECLV